MREVDRPYCRPMHCAALPFVGQTTQNTRWIDTGSELDGFDNHVYLSETAIRQCWEVLGLPSPQQYELAVAQAEEAITLLEERTAELEEARRELQAIDALESAGYTRRAKSRPKAAA